MTLSLDDLQARVRGHAATAIFFSAPGCGICQVLKPKLLGALREEFGQLHIETVDCSLQPEVAAQFGVFSVPSLLVFFEGKEALRKSRVMGVAEVVAQIRRPYDLLFT